MKKTILLTAAALALSVPAFAADAAMDKMTPAPGHEHEMGKKGHNMFSKADADGNGIVSKSEFMAVQDKFFAEADTNSDGQITQDEAEAQKARWRDKMKQMREERMKQRAADKPAEAPKTPSAK